MLLQQAVETKALPLLTAVKVAGLPKTIQEQIATKVESLLSGNGGFKGGAKAIKAIVSAHVKPAKREPGVGEELRDYVAGLRQGRERLAPKLEEIRRGRYDQEVEELRQSRRFQGRLISRLQSLTRESEKYFKQLDEEDERARRQIRGEEDEGDGRSEGKLPDEAYVP
jgi:hypothetical protein